MPPMKTVTHHFRILGLGLSLAGPPGVMEPIATAYRRFAAAETDVEEPVRIELDADGELRVDGEPVRLVPNLDQTLQVYQQFLATLMDRIGSHAILHAAALVGPAGGALLLAAPSGHGKSSLTLELARRGLRFMGDDYAPLDLDRREVWPYPRTVGLTLDESTPIPEDLRGRIRDHAVTKLFGKSLLDVGELLGEATIADEPASLRHVILLTSHTGGGGKLPDTTRIDLASRIEDADELEELFAATDGAEIVQRKDLEHLRVWRLRLRHDRRPTEALSKAFDSGRIVLLEKYWDKKPDFASPPRATPIKRREAAEFLGRELLNRRGGSRLLARYGNSVAALFLDLAGALREADCWQVAVGRCAETAELIQEVTARR